MRRLVRGGAKGLGAAAGLALMAAPTAAQTGDAGPDRQCRALWAAVTATGGTFSVSGTYEGVAEGWCRFSGLFVVTEGYAPDWELDALQLKGNAPGFLVLGEGSGPDLDLALRVQGLRLVPQIGQPLFDWLYRAQARGFGISGELAADWEAAAGVLTLSRLALDFPGRNAVTATARVAGVDLSSAEAIAASGASFAVTEARLDVTSHGLFESWVLLPLGEALLQDAPDMDAEVEALRAAVLRGIAGLPEAAFPAPTRGALEQLVQDLPNPAGRLTLELAASPGIGASQAAALLAPALRPGPEGWEGLSGGMKVTATWTREARQD